MNRIAVFADVQNIYYTTRDTFGRQFNYRKFWQKIKHQGVILSATAYAIDRGDDQQLKFQDALRHIGFKVRLKPYIQRSDGTAKGDWDVGISIDMMEMAQKVDTVILLSGDGDFDLLLQKVHASYGVITEVYAVQALTAHSLVEACQRFYAIQDDLLI